MPVCVMGADVAQQFLRAGLVDVLHLHLAPVLLGAGRPPFGRLATGHVELRRTGVVESPYATHLRLRVVK
jgi:riboflavin biosynthesis pyrimidine reductase